MSSLESFEGSLGSGAEVRRFVTRRAGTGGGNYEAMGIQEDLESFDFCSGRAESKWSGEGGGCRWVCWGECRGCGWSSDGGEDILARLDQLIEFGFGLRTDKAESGGSGGSSIDEAVLCLECGN